MMMARRARIIEWIIDHEPLVTLGIVFFLALVAIDYFDGGYRAV